MTYRMHSQQHFLNDVLDVAWALKRLRGQEAQIGRNFLEQAVIGLLVRGLRGV